MTTKAWFVYLLHCADGSLYTGITVNMERRLAQHNGAQPGGAKYTSGRRPVTLVYLEEQENRQAASRRERQLRQLPRAAKLALTKDATKSIH